MRQNHIFLKEMRTPPYQTQHLTSLPTLSLISLCVHVERLNVVTGTSMQRSILWILMPWMTKAAYMTPQEIHHFGAQCRVRLLAQALLPCHSSIISIQIPVSLHCLSKMKPSQSPKNIVKKRLNPKTSLQKCNLKSVLGSQLCVSIMCVPRTSMLHSACYKRWLTEFGRGGQLEVFRDGEWNDSLAPWCKTSPSMRGVYYVEEATRLEAALNRWTGMCATALMSECRAAVSTRYGRGALWHPGCVALMDGGHQCLECSEAVFTTRQSENIIERHVLGVEGLQEELSDCWSKWSHPSKSNSHHTVWSVLHCKELNHPKFCSWKQNYSMRISEFWNWPPFNPWVYKKKCV